MKTLSQKICTFLYVFLFSFLAFGRVAFPLDKDQGLYAAYEKVTIAFKPYSVPQFEAGKTITYSAIKGTGTYTWTVAGPGILTESTGDILNYSIPSTGAFAGLYTVTVKDGTAEDSFNFKVPPKLEPSTNTIIAEGGKASYTLTVSGLPNDVSSVKASILDYASQKVVQDPKYGTIGPTGSQDTYTYINNSASNEPVHFIIQLQVNSSYLKSIGLDLIRTDKWTIIPSKTYAGVIKGKDINQNKFYLKDALVQVVAPSSYAGITAITDENGNFSMELPYGPLYTFFVQKELFVGKTFSSKDWNFQDKSKNSITLSPAYYHVKGSLKASGLPYKGLANVSLIHGDTNIGETISYNGNFYIGVDKPESDTDGAVVFAKYFITAAAPGLYTSSEISSNFVSPTLENSPELSIELQELPQQAETVNIKAASGSNISYFSPKKKIAGQDISVLYIPAGSIKGEFSDVTISIKSNPYTGTVFNVDEVYEITIKSGTEGVSLNDSIHISIPFLLKNIQSGDFESGKQVIYQAESLQNLYTGKFKKEIGPTYISSVDYVGDGTYGAVTFRVKSLSVFAVGSASAQTTTSSGEGGGGGGGCFIATAAFGSPLEPHVMLFKRFRDEFLHRSSIGRGLIELYYRYSPPIAAHIENHPDLRFLVRISLLPMAGFIWLILYYPILTITGVILSFSGAIFLMQHILRRRHRS